MVFIWFQGMCLIHRKLPLHYLDESCPLNGRCIFLIQLAVNRKEEKRGYIVLLELWSLCSPEGWGPGPCMRFEAPKSQSGKGAALDWWRSGFATPPAQSQEFTAKASEPDLKLKT